MGALHTAESPSTLASSAEMRSSVLPHYSIGDRRQSPLGVTEASRKFGAVLRDNSYCHLEIALQPWAKQYRGLSSGKGP